MILFDQVIHPSSLSLFPSSRCCSAVLSDLRPTSPTFISLFFTLYSHLNSSVATFFIHFTPFRPFPLPTLGVLVPPEKESEKREKEKEEKLQGRRESHGENLLRDLKGIFTQPWEMASPTEGNRQSLKENLGLWEPKERGWRLQCLSSLRWTTVFCVIWCSVLKSVSLLKVFHKVQQLFYVPL